MKRTRWYPAHIKPARVGFYERNYRDKDMQAIPDYWDGLQWIVCDEFGEALSLTGTPIPWRGLVRPA